MKQSKWNKDFQAESLRFFGIINNMRSLHQEFSNLTFNIMKQSDSHLMLRLLSLTMSVIMNNELNDADITIKSVD